MSGLSFGVVRVDQENSLTSLTLQDVGQVLPGTLVAVVRLNSNGGICLSSSSNGANPVSSTSSTVSCTTSTTTSSSSAATGSPSGISTGGNSGGSNSSSAAPQLCQTDEIGEICVSSRSTADCYFGLSGLSTNVFKLIPHGSDNMPIGNQEFVRSGLLGFLGPGGLVFVCGSKEGLIEVGGRRHNTDDIIATVLAVEPMKFIYRGR
jgi:acyl-CoA synthetase (AMP-forming)/AMP-acid ligase II